MPRIPVYERQIAAPDLRMDPGVFAGSGEALARGGLVVAQIAGDAAARFAEAAAAQRLMQAQGQLTREMADLRLSFDTDNDWQTMPKRFEQRSVELMEGWRKRLKDDPRVLGSLETDFLRSQTRDAIDVTRLARTRQTQAGKADLETVLDIYGQELSRDADPLRQAEIEGRARAAIQGLVAGGLLHADEGQKREQQFFGRVTEQKSLALIQNDPATAVSRLLDANDRDFGSMEPLARERALKAAQGRVEMLQRQQNADAERREREADKRLRETQERAGDDAFALLRDGKLDRETLERNRRNLASSDYRALLRELSADRVASDDPATVTALTRQLDQLAPLEFERAAARAVEQGLIKTETYRALADRNRLYTREDRPASPFRAARELVSTTLDPGAIFQGAGAAIGRAAQAQALVEIDNWADANPRASRSEALAEAQNIAKRYQTIRFDQLSLALGVPRFHAGARDGLDAAALDAAETATLAALDAGRLSQAQADQEARKIEGWRAILANKAAAKPAAKPGNPR